ncbi:MAG: DUF2243 domain-containing protein [Anaerolineae bacterium]|jgi:uncharacterized membrane protein|nr:DUF2243 domain-containing protein [Anaerolineae bacterium]
MADFRTAEANISGLRRAGIVLGLGFGGFVDGIVLHQILQWHHMLTAEFPPDSVGNLQLNTLADGLFHAGTWVISLIGLVMLYRATVGRQYRPSGRVLAGAMVMGWGIFNLVEGLVNHYILQIHHVRPGPNQGAYDLAFMILGAALMVAGWWISRSRERTTAEAPA